MDSYSLFIMSLFSCYFIWLAVIYKLKAKYYLDGIEFFFLSIFAFVGSLMFTFTISVMAIVAPLLLAFLFIGFFVMLYYMLEVRRYERQ